MSGELPKQYDPRATQAAISEKWLEAGAFAALPDERRDRYVVMMPLPNVTGALHMGHAMDNVMQDLLVRWHRMKGDNTLWMPGTDHAGIATQAVVEKRLKELEGKDRHDVGRDGLVARIWDWKEKCQVRIIQQQQAMGCSCDWDRQRFTMDAVCASAVRETFFRMFRDGLIHRGNRLVNWDCHLKTAVSDDEVYHETVAGHFWHIRYPVIDPEPGEPAHVVVATTRPETMLGDTAVACHPDPKGALDAQVAELRERLAAASDRERPALEEELERLEQHRKQNLHHLRQLADMAAEGCRVRLPLQDRPIPLIRDEWAKPELGSGCVKITPAHDPNDFEVWERHKESIGLVNILEPDGTLNAQAGAYAGLDRLEARRRVVADLEAQGLLEAVEDREVEIGHSDRSKTPVEPCLSKQWFVRMGDVDGGITMGRGTPKEFTSSGLAQAAMDAVRGEWRSPTGLALTFHPDPIRYGNTYTNWLAEKRDWCISRQLWWGHRIPIWSRTVAAANLDELAGRLPADDNDVCIQVAAPDEERSSLKKARKKAAQGQEGPFEIQVCLRDEDAEKRCGAALEAAGLAQDPDVLDTWFSSAIWPHSTLGWPDPEAAQIEAGQSPLASVDGRPDALSYYYPGSCLVTARDIITLWVARMVMLGLYNQGDMPFTDVFIHATILDGKGVRMSKSKGNGIDPEDIIESYGADAMRYVLCDMQTGMQDIRLPVQAVSPFTGELVDLATAKHGRSIFTYICPESGKEFDVLGTIEELPSAKIISNRFEVGRNFCNKLWNAARFTLMNFGDEALEFRPLAAEDLAPEDRWILSRLSHTVGAVDAALAAYNPAEAIGAAREFFWGAFCDWYLEMIKPRLRDPEQAPVARQVLAVGLDQVLRLLQPFVPFVTEAIWERLREHAPVRGISVPLLSSDLVISAAWPESVPAWEDDALEAAVDRMQEVTRVIRDLRARYDIPPSRRLHALIKADGPARASLAELAPHVKTLANLDHLQVHPELARPELAAAQVVGEVEVFLDGVIDVAKERKRLRKQKENVLQQLRASEGKLGNESFVARAPEKVVEAERSKLADLQGQLERLEKNITALPDR